jgi:hypothetical protein
MAEGFNRELRIGLVVTTQLATRNA